MTARVGVVLVLLAASTACASPEVGRGRGGGPGADPGNHATVVEVHGGAKMYYRTPCRTIKVKCSGLATSGT